MKKMGFSFSSGVRAGKTEQLRLLLWSESFTFSNKEYDHCWSKGRVFAF